MPLNRPYFPIHRIYTGQYTTGGEFYKTDGEIYIGPYHILPNGSVWTGFVPIKSSVELHVLTGLMEEAGVYRKLTSVKTGKYTAPQFHLPVVTDEDKNAGFLMRYFVQKKNEPRSTITEIDFDQFGRVNKNNSKGINGVLWKKISIPWYITGTVNIIIEMNTRVISKTELEFPGIKKYLTNLIDLFS